MRCRRALDTPIVMRDTTRPRGIRSIMSLVEVCAACAGALVMPIVLSLFIRRYRCPDGVRPPRIL